MVPVQGGFGSDVEWALRCYEVVSRSDLQPRCLLLKLCLVWRSKQGSKEVTAYGWGDGHQWVTAYKVCLDSAVN